MHRSRIVGVAVAVAAGTGVTVLSRANASPPVVNHPPVVTSSLAPNATYGPAEPVRITVTVTDADGDLVNARVVDGPRELSFTPIRNAPSGTTREIVYYHEGSWVGNDVGPQRFVVEAWDARQPWRKTRTTFRFRIIGRPSSHGLRLLQLDQDAAPEILACARLGDVAGVVDAGAFAMFDAPYPSTRFDADPGLWTADPLQAGDFYDHEEQIGDLNADGLDDVVAVVAHERVAIWFGGTTRGTRPPDVTLRSSSPRADSQVDGALLVTDVTGDGIDDVVVGFPWADSYGMRDTGEVLVFAGGPTFAARGSTPTATLRVPNPNPFQGLGYTLGTFDPLRVGDVTGDGIADLLVASPGARVGAKADVGAIYVWNGGAALAGTPAPVATLATTGSAQSRDLGYAETFPALFLVDVTGDGQLDVVAGAPHTVPEGAIFIWQGGSGIAGAVDPTARLEPSPGASSGSGSGLPSTELSTDSQGLQFADVDLDGITDVIAARSRASVGGGGLAGAIYVFAGGSLSGTVNETAFLRRTTPRNYDTIATANDGLQLVDVTGDGAPDVISGSFFTDASPNGFGAVEVFAARSGLSGTITPSASLEVPGAGSVRLLKTGELYDASVGLLIEDVTGDGIRDVVGVAALEDFPSPTHQGAIHVWTGGSNLTSGATVAPSATLRDPNAPENSRLGERIDVGPAVHFVDWDDDGVKDLVVSERALPASQTTPLSTSRAVVWRGGATLTGTPAPFATAPATQFDDGFGGFDGHDLYPCGLWFGDVTGDDLVDLLVTAQKHDTPLNQEAGAVYVFAGGPTSSGTLAPVALLEDPFGLAGDRFGGTSELAIADLDSDGINDLVATSPDASGTGRVLVFRGPISSTTTGRDLFAPKLGGSPGLGQGGR